MEEATIEEKEQRSCYRWFCGYHNVTIVLQKKNIFLYRALVKFEMTQANNSPNRLSDKFSSTWGKGQ